VAINILGSGAACLAVGTAFDALRDPIGGPDDVRFYLVLAVAAAVVLAMTYLVVTPLATALDGQPVIAGLRPPRQILPALALNVALAVSLAAVYHRIGIAALVFLILNVFAFTYMARLVATARERTREYAALSWGVLSGLLRTLDIRDTRAARHSAAVAAFSRDIAETSGMTPRECELAHTAGLLHDIGRFALSDRVMERGGTLEVDDWQGIQRHCEIGADLLRDIGVYGPLAEIVRAHHERVDGRGYPDGLSGEQIPPIARIVAVAEVYDTLTADDTYRTPLTSFEAIRELRRVAGTQLDRRYVEALAELLAGRGIEYRHADAADFDRELDLERRINDAATRRAVGT